MISGCGKGVAQQTGKIISINPCTDAILLELADSNQIGAISHFSHDEKSSSTDLGLARQYPSIGQSAEEIIAQKPSLVLAGSHVSASTLAVLEELDIKVLQIPVANSIQQSHSQITTIAKAIGQQERGNMLITKIDSALKDAESDTAFIPAIVWQGGGLIPGKNTLIDDIMTRVGYDNIVSDYGLAQWDVIGLERLSANPPAIILRGGNGNERMLQHEILEEIDSQITDFPQSLIWCAGPTIAKAADQLKRIRLDYQKALKH